MDLDLVRTLLAVVDAGTFDAAAAMLHVTPSAVSQRIKALEQRTGRVLLVRARPVRLTPSGEVLVRYGRQLLALDQDLDAALGSDAVVRVPIAVNADSLATWFLPALQRVPSSLKISFDLHREDQDHTTALLRQGVVMAAVTSSREPVAGCSVRKLGSIRYAAMAPQSFIDTYADGPVKSWLPDAPVVVFDRNDDLQDRFVRTLTRGRGAAEHRHYVPSSEVYVRAIVAGLGWGMVPPQQLQEGLVDLAPGRTVDIPLYWQQWKLDSPALTAVADAVAAEAAVALR
ncbi:LysR family transcriptional regulator (chromosome initiation inhibitor) [Lentzea atacamensis]|uniref:HTH-type transcriptional regulator LysG n=1 Tax=Lentzea atacamensis TaxID=531938 RepID=A0A316HK67_9PSEU|nr:LysR family transcriptional regulator ArgP [Lentzea atacamensis]PWK81043.1 LysR family transcriptional regulator (chromosome initiation inhibitor) [Lentzea atacamensis]